MSDGGWYYQGTKGKSYGSVTAGAVSSLAIYELMLGNNPRKNQAIEKGLKWLSDNFTVKENPHGKVIAHYQHYYYLYCLERVGALLGAEKIGDHHWYQEGADYIVKHQKPNGSWLGESPDANEIWALTDTCFAILFLKRATQHLIDTGGGFENKGPEK